VDDVAGLARKVLELLPGEAVGKVGDVDAAGDADDLLLSSGSASAAGSAAAVFRVACEGKVRSVFERFLRKKENGPACFAGKKKKKKKDINGFA